MLADVVELKLSPLILATLLLMLAASVWVFIMLVRRETRRRQWSAIRQWARGKSMRPVDAPHVEPADLASLQILASHNPRPQLLIISDRLTLAQLATDGSSTFPTAKALSWNLLILNLPQKWSPTGLRPTAHHSSILDLFSLSSFPSMLPPERFILFGTDSLAARTLAEASISTLLPPDIGLLITGESLVLDFTTRHFDPIEFGRIIDIAEQIAPRLQAAMAR